MAQGQVLAITPDGTGAPSFRKFPAATAGLSYSRLFAHPHRSSAPPCERPSSPYGLPSWQFFGGMASVLSRLLGILASILHVLLGAILRERWHTQQQNERQPYPRYQAFHVTLLNLTLIAFYECRTRAHGRISGGGPTDLHRSRCRVPEVSQFRLAQCERQR